MSETTTPTTSATTPMGSDPSNGTGGHGGEGMRAAAHDATERARDIAGAGKAEAGTVVEEVRTQASQLVGTAGRQARERADEQLGGAARRLGDMSDELDRMAAASSGGGPLEAVARDGATMMRRLSSRFDEGGLDGIMDDVRGFARRRPGTFIAGAFALGIVGGRVLRNADLRSVREQANQSGQRSGQGDGPDLSGRTIDTGYAGEALRDAGMATQGGFEGAALVETASIETAGIEADWDAPTGGRMP